MSSLLLITVIGEQGWAMQWDCSYSDPLPIGTYNTPLHRPWGSPARAKSESSQWIHLPRIQDKRGEYVPCGYRRSDKWTPPQLEASTWGCHSAVRCHPPPLGMRGWGGRKASDITHGSTRRRVGEVIPPETSQLYKIMVIPDVDVFPRGTSLSSADPTLWGQAPSTSHSSFREPFWDHTWTV